MRDSGIKIAAPSTWKQLPRLLFLSSFSLLASQSQQFDSLRLLLLECLLLAIGQLETRVLFVDQQAE